MAQLLRHLSLASATVASTIPKVSGNTVVGALTSAPRILAGVQDVVSTLPSAISGIKPGPTVKAAFELAHIPMNPETIGESLGNLTQSSLDANLQSNLDSINDIFSALGLRVWIVCASTADARARVKVVTPGEEVAVDKETEIAGLTPRQFVRFLHEARKSGSMGQPMEMYIERMEKDGRLHPIPMVPRAFQHKLYLDIARLMVFTFQRVFLMLDGTSVWGHSLTVKTLPSLPGSSKRSRPTRIGEEHVKMIVDKMLESQAVNMGWVPDMIERRLYANCIMVVFELLDDFLTGDGEEVNFMGHKLSFYLEPEPISVLRQKLKDQPVPHCQIDEDVLTELVDEILADSDTNIQWIPDVVESQIYKGVLRLMIRILEEIAARLKMKMLGRDIEVRIFGAADMKAYDAQFSMGNDAQAVHYYAEENPFQTVSSTELEERLKEIDEQKKVLEAIQKLGAAQFDLTAEKAMLGADIAILAESANVKRKTGGEFVPAAKSVRLNLAEVPEGVHDFCTHAHTHKLARTLSVTIEVQADIQIPWSMIADLETYPDWMPWCTSGKVLESQPTEQRFSSYDGEVGFGFETGSFLGTLGDTVSYRVAIVKPLDVSLASGTATSPTTEEIPESATTENVDEALPEDYGRVVADAVKGFAYGDKLLYDWRFRTTRPGVTTVQLDMLFQASSVLYMPVWDSMQNMVMDKMLVSFRQRAELLAQKSKETKK